MKMKIFSMVLVLALLASQSVLAESLFDLSLMQSAEKAISYGVSMGKEPISQQTLSDGSKQEMYVGVTDEDFLAFGTVLAERGYSSATQDVANNLYTTVVAKGETQITIQYDRSAGALTVTYPAPVEVEVEVEVAEAKENFVEMETPETYDDELFGGLTEELERQQEEQMVILETEYMLPFNCEQMTEEKLGTCKLLQHQYNLENNTYSAYVFDKINQEVVEALANQNVDENHYELVIRTINDCEFYELTQYGREARKVMIAPEFNGYTLLLIQVGLNVVNAPSVIPNIYVPCTICVGSGECQSSNCNSGICAECGGTGYDKCNICNGTGDCQHCDGTGIRSSSYDYFKFCSGCDATGDCQYCDGKGYQSEYSHHECFECRGTGQCTLCKGTNRCYFCGGDGNSAN